MKERGKAVEMYSNDLYDHQDYSFSSDLPCKKHPSSASVGICPYCLKDRLLKLVCSDCGEQRLSSCSCSSEISSNRNSCTVDVGSVGRISFLLDNDQRNQEGSSISSNCNKPKSSSGAEKAAEVDLFLKRSSSSCVEIKRKRGFWRIKRLFSKKREKGACDRNSVGGGFEEKSDLWVVDYMGVSRCRSLCSFRGGGFFGSEDGTFSGARSSMSAARSSISAARSSGVNAGLLFDPDRKSGYSEAEPRKSGFDAHDRRDIGIPASGLEAEAHTRRVFSLKEGNFTTLDDSGFIDLKFDFPSSDSKAAEFSTNGVKMMSNMADSSSGFGSMRGGGEDQFGGVPFAGLVGDGVFSGNGGSCRFTVSDRGIKRSRKSFKSWRWIFRQHPGAAAKKKEEEFVAVKNLA